VTYPLVPCDVCGPLSPPARHTVCHPWPNGWGPHGCGHDLDDHTDGMRCRVCRRDCAGWQPPNRTEHEPEHDPDQEALF